MNDTVIRVENLSKKYFLRHQQRERYVALRDVMARGVKNLGKKLVSPFTSNPLPFTDSREAFYALKDIAFEVKKGERIGIIGRNGAGKSTLLKILSRITEPTTGRVEIKGRVASLLEVGTGFHPELSGRENIFLNGAILGMTRAEIRRKFDEIVDFAEIEKFLDTPVKHFSSGMYVRLAFAVAAHLEPEILLVDEVLAVGDTGFQKKCLGKMSEVSESGKTIFFVSHNMGAISSLCSKGIYLKEGQIERLGDVERCISEYIAGWSNSHERISALAALQRTSADSLRGAARLQSIEMISEDGEHAWQIPFPKNLAFKVIVRVFRELPTLEVGIALYNNSFVEIASSLSSDSLSVETVRPGEYEITAEFQDLFLLPGTYVLGLGLKSGLSDIVLEDYIREAAYFEVMPSDASVARRAYTRRGVLIPKVEYSISQRRI